jgi:hypothetical protein
MKTIVRWGLKIISLITFGFSLLSAWMFYVFYLKWVWVFEDGRYFDPVEEVVYHDTSFIWGVISFVLLLLSSLFWFVASRIKRVRTDS